MSLLEKLKKNSTIKDTAILSKSKFFAAKDMIQTSIPVVNVAFSGDLDGGFTHHSQGVNFRNRDEFLKSFEKIKEDVVLLGVGLQKDYGVILRDEFGKIAIDMGATMDAWSGIISRPWFNKGQSQEHLLV